MRHVLLSLFILGLALTLGCSRETPAPAKDGKIVAALTDGGKVQVTPPGENPKPQPAPVGFTAPQPMPEPAAPAESESDKYEAALTEGLVHMADQKWEQALQAFESAQRFNDSEFVRGEITKLRQRVEQDTAAKKTVSDISKVLEEGKATDAAKLAQQALKEFGDGDASAQLVKLRLQADALQNASSREEAAARAQRYRDEGEAALREQNLRAAALAFEQSLQARDDARLQEQLDDVRGRLQKYDGLRRRAAELRRDPQHLEEALEALNDAAKAWDTLQLRQDIDECNLALQKRRDNLSVADFEIRGNFGFADAGRTIAEELLPHFKSRFDLVERGQLAKVIAELKLDDSFADDPDDQRELSRLAKVRYLVLGSVSRLSGVTVSARLVDAKSGLVVQTGKVSAPTIDDAIPLLPMLAKQLLMSDEEKLAYDEQQLRLAKKITPPADDAPLPPPPPPVVIGAAPAPPPPVFEMPAPPPFLGVTIDHFRRLPSPPAVFVKVVPPPPPVVIMEHRLLHASLALGDDLYRRGRYAEANRHFEFALNLSPGNFDLRLRLERTRPYLPPPVVIVQPVVAPVVVVRHRIAVLDFAAFGDPRAVPPGLGHWTALQLAPYFRARYDVVDPAEVYWWMGRLGMTMRDVLEDPAARRWLARAVGVRYFVVGALVETASFNVDAYLLDAEFGYVQGSASVHVRNPFELKLRLGEVAQLTMIDLVERTRFLADADRFNALLLRGRQSYDRGEFSVAIGIFDDCLKLRPGHVEVMFHLTNARRRHEVFLIEEARRQQYLRQQAFAAEAARRQWELARAAELARVRAAQEAALWDTAQRRRVEEDRLRAHQNMLVQARVAIKTKNFTLALDFFKGAADIVPPQPVIVGFTPQPEIYREMALARAETERAVQVRAAEAAAIREAALRKQREAELIKTRQKLAQEKQLVAETQKKANEERDRLLYQASFDDGQRLMAEKKYAAALSSLQAARRVKSTPVVEQMINLAVQQQTLASAKGDAERQQIEAKLAAERDRRLEAEKQTKQNQAKYQTTLSLADKAFAQKQYTVAQAQYEAAGKLFQTDAVLTGLRRVEAARAAETQQAQAETARAARIQQLLTEGRTALEAKEFAKAVNAYQQAKKIAPANLDVLAGLSQAEESRAKYQAAAQRQADDAARQKDFQHLLQSGQANLKAKQFDAAAAALSEALKLKPGDAIAKAALQDAETGRKNASTNSQALEAAKKKTEVYQALMADGRRALQGKRYDDAIKAFGDAQKLLPGDQTSAGFLKDAQQAKTNASTAVAAAAKKRAEFQTMLSVGKKALDAKRYDDAVKTLTAANALVPDDKTGQDLLRQAQRARADANFADDVGKLAKADKVKDLLSTVQIAISKKDFLVADKAFAEASKLLPNDPSVAQAQKELTAARQAAAAGAAQDKAFQAALADGQKAMKAKNYKEAVQAFQQAAKIRPNDAQVTNLLEIAQRELRRTTTTSPDEPKKKDDVKKKDDKKKEEKKKDKAEVQSLPRDFALVPGNAVASPSWPTVTPFSPAKRPQLIWLMGGRRSELLA